MPVSPTGSFVVTAIFTVALVSAACSETPIVRRGPAQQRLVARTYGDSKVQVRANILDAFRGSRSRLPEPFQHMMANALEPPLFSPDWLVTLTDPGGDLEPYKLMPPDEKVSD